MYDELLVDVIAEWRRTGVLTAVIATVIEVWTSNTQRHEPSAGDDALTLGLLSSRNIANLLETKFRHRHDVLADQPNLSLRVSHRGRTLRVYKLAGTSTLADPEDANWSASETKQAGPINNTNGTQLSLTDYPAGAAAFAQALPAGPEHLHLVWAGDPENGKLAIHLGFPRDNREGGSPWHAVQCVYRDELQQPLPVVPAATGGAPRFDDLDAPEVAVHLRTGREEESL